MYTGKSKNAQETHEAIRPSGDTFRTPTELQSTLRGNDWKLYDLIWKRTVASQMADAKGSTASVVVAATTAQPVTGITPGAPVHRDPPGRDRRRHDRRVRRHRHRDHLPRFPLRLRGGSGRRPPRRRR